MIRKLMCFFGLHEWETHFASKNLPYKSESEMYLMAALEGLWLQCFVCKHCGRIRR